MVNEVRKIEANAAKVQAGDEPEIPMLLFVSNGEDTGFDPQVWARLQRDFSQLENRDIIELDAPHYIHYIGFERIARESYEFVERLSVHE